MFSEWKFDQMPREPVQVFPLTQEILFQAFYLNNTPLNHNWVKLHAFHKKNQTIKRTKMFWTAIFNVMF